MSIVSNKSFLTDEYQEIKDSEFDELPALITSKPEVMSIKKSFLISTALHPAVIMLIWLISIILY